MSKPNEINEKKLLLLYFSGSFCPISRAFTPRLKDFYDEVNFENKMIEIIYVPFDKTEEEFNQYFRNMPWVAVPHGDKRVQEYAKNYQVKAIP